MSILDEIDAALTAPAFEDVYPTRARTLEQRQALLADEPISPIAELLTEPANIPAAPGPDFEKRFEATYAKTPDLPAILAARREEARMRRSLTFGGKVSDTLTAARMRTTNAMAEALIQGEPLQEPELNAIQDIAATVISFIPIVDPVPWLTFGFGGATARAVIGRGTAEIAKRGLARKAAQRSMQYGIGLAGLTAIQEPMRQKLATGEVSLPETAKAVGESLATGVTAGAAGAIPLIGLPAEIAAFVGAPALIKQRMPARQDWIHATGVILGIKGANLTGVALLKLARGEKLTSQEEASISDLDPETRGQIAMEAAAARATRIGTALATAEAKGIDLPAEPSRVEMAKVLPGVESDQKSDRAEIAKLQGEYNAAKERVQQEGRVPEHPGDEAFRPPAEAGGRRGAEQREQVVPREVPEAQAPQAEVTPVAPGGELGFVSLDDMSQQVRKGGSAVKALAKRYMTGPGDLPQPVFEAKIAKKDWARARAKEASFAVRDFDKAAKEVYGGRNKITPQDHLLINAVLAGEQPATRLPEQFHAPIAQMRQAIDALSQQMIDQGIVEGKLRAILDENLGFYVHRSYRAFDDPQWAKKVPQEVRTKMKAEFRSMYPDASEEELHGLMDSILYAAKESGSPISMLASGKLGRKNLSIFIERKNLTPTFREFLGEYTDARINFVRSVEKMAGLVANHQFLTEAQRAGEGRFFFAKPTGEHIANILQDVPDYRKNSLSPLSKTPYTTPEIAEALKQAVAISPFVHSALFRHYMKVNSAVKFNKTVGSLVTHERNTLSALGLLTAQGHIWHLRGAEQAKQLLGTELNLKDPKEWRDYVVDATEHGIVGESVRSNELRDMIQDATRQGIEAVAEGVAAKRAKQLGRAATKLYALEDDWRRVFAWENEKRRHRKALPNLSEAEIKKIAARKVRDTDPTYSLVPESVKMLRRFPAIGPFVSWQAEIIRTSKNTLKYIGEELADPRTRAIGAERLAGAMLAATLAGGLSLASAYLVGENWERIKRLRRFLAPWNRNSNLFFLQRNERGQSRMVDLSYVDPHAYLKKPLLALLRGEDWQKKLWDGVVEVAEPFVGEEILAEKLLDISRNRTREGFRVYNPQAPLESQLADVLGHLYPVLEPGTADTARRIKRGWSGEVSQGGKAYDPYLESVAALTGQRVVTPDVLQSFSYKASRYKRGLEDSASLVTSVAGRRGRVSEAELRDAFGNMTISHRRLLKELHLDIEAARGLGEEPDDLRNILRARGFSRREIALVMSGAEDVYRPGRSFLRSKMIESEILKTPGAATPEDFQARKQFLIELAAQE